MERRRLPSYAVEAYDILRETVSSPDENIDKASISPEAAKDALADADQEFTDGDIEHVLELLYNRGEIYYVNDRIRFTDAEDFDRRYHE